MEFFSRWKTSFYILYFSLIALFVIVSGTSIGYNLTRNKTRSVSRAQTVENNYIYIVLAILNASGKNQDEFEKILSENFDIEAKITICKVDQTNPPCGEYQGTSISKPANNLINERISPHQLFVTITADATGRPFSPDDQYKINLNDVQLTAKDDAKNIYNNFIFPGTSFNFVNVGGSREFPFNFYSEDLAKTDKRTSTSTITSSLAPKPPFIGINCKITNMETVPIKIIFQYGISKFIPLLDPDKVPKSMESYIIDPGKSKTYAFKTTTDYEGNPIDPKNDYFTTCNIYEENSNKNIFSNTSTRISPNKYIDIYLTYTNGRISDGDESDLELECTPRAYGN